MITQRPFGTLPAGVNATLYSLNDGPVTVRVCDLGATVMGIEAPDATGTAADIVLGYDNAAAYVPNTPFFFGATVGPSANRVAQGAVPIGDTVYHLPQNENGNNLHTDHEHGLHALLWEAHVDEDVCAVQFRCNVADGTYGLPGARTFTVRYALAAAQLTVDYEATTDVPTFINLTNHTYFNMAGHAAGSVLGQTLQIAASRYLPIDAASIPTGELRDVENTPFDFRAAHAIGDAFDADNEQLALAHGYDHCFCLDGYDDETSEKVAESAAAEASTASATSAETRMKLQPRLAARAMDPVSGRGMELWTTLPGLQLYTGNFLDEGHGKGGACYRSQEGFALEPQFFPATPSYPAFPQPIFDAAHPYRARNEYRFFTV